MSSTKESTELNKLACDSKSDLPVAFRDQLLSVGYTQSHISIYAKDLNGCFIIANLSTVRQLGLDSESQLIGKTDNDFMPAAQANEYADDERQVIATGIPLLGKTERLTHPDGTAGWWMTDKVPLRDADGSVVGILGTTRDVSALMRPEELFNRTVEAARCIVWTAMVRKSADGDFKWQLNIINEGAARQMLPLPLMDEISYASAWTKSRYNGKEQISSLEKQVLESGVSHYECTYEMRAANQSLRQVTQNSSVESMGENQWRVVSVCVDSTERVNLEREVRVAEERLRLAIEGAEIGTWHTNFETGERYWSPKCKELLGMSEDHVIDGYSFWDSVHPDDMETVRAQVQSCVSSGEPLAIEYRTVWPDGTSHWLLTKGKSYVGPDGIPLRMEGLIQNIDLRKAEEEEIAQSWRREKATAAMLQKAMLQMPPGDSFDNLQLSTMYASATEHLQVGGDLMDAFPLPYGKVALIVGDVSGKGLLAAARTADVKYALRAFLSETGSPGDALTKLNRYVSHSFSLEPTTGSAFVCITAIIVDVYTGHIVFSAAGSEPPIMISGYDIVQQDQPNLPVGVDEATVYADATFDIKPNDKVLILTDGITEARSGGECFGLNGLFETLRMSCPSDSLDDTLQKVVDDAARYSKHGITDDVCMMMFQWSPAQ